ncbi:hypothetical protein DC363_16450 [Thalassorhabdomicrobium marinisediminis]|uniref:Sulfotransferase domain-containing protein n=2 Tax=Thalassorhabdomicrobium marinisediminis TaxID=2170577 RepID=A0A2T7FSR4_9RHOB|nr:hypothetical protein DC363_16450 [Thalassorhabdomicrobium marinisediminis]
MAKSECKKSFISSEEFFSCPSESIIALRNALDAERIHILATLRRPDTLLVSIYNQKAKQPGNRFVRGIGHFVEDPCALDRDMDFEACVTPWMDAFGKENTIIRLYEDGSSVVQMLRILGLSADALPMPSRLNESVPGVVTEMMRVAKFSQMGKVEQIKLYQLASQRMADRPPFFLSDADRRTVIRILQPRIDNLFKRLGRANPYRLECYTPIENGANRPNVTLADLMQLIDHLLQRS